MHTNTSSRQPDYVLREYVNPAQIPADSFFAKLSPSRHFTAKCFQNKEKPDSTLSTKPRRKQTSSRLRKPAVIRPKFATTTTRNSHLPRLSHRTGAVERCCSSPRLLGFVRGVHDALAVILVGHGCRQRHAIIVGYLKETDEI